MGWCKFAVDCKHWHTETCEKCFQYESYEKEEKNDEAKGS
jgi:hypothetical protein